tara:strand:+ start:22253 stop:22465 length:213 start_codon:yes stop_codon:yes gene_type:complete
MTLLFKTITAVFFITMLSACSGPFSDYNNYDLSQAYAKCDFSKLTAAGAQRCTNIKKECDKRKDESGFRC